ncbi:MAG TPA: hypothetical protein PK530_10075, partial [Anaerolineales bacterium]|nr:hypothetical protein [Anaerolineales bacterium]
MQSLPFFLEIDALSAKNGWMDCWLIGKDGGRNHLDATSFFPPFKDLLGLAKALVTNHLPFEFFWDEEGHGAKFTATPAEEETDFHLLVNHDGVIIIDYPFRRMQAVHGVLAALREVALYCPRADSEWELPFFLIEKFEQDLMHNFSNTTPSAMQIIHFVFSQYGGYGGAYAPGFTIWVDERPLLYLALEDRTHLWQNWFELMKHIVQRTLPIEITFQEEGAEAELISLLFGRTQTFLFRAEPLPDTQHFHLQIQAPPSPSPSEKQVFLLDTRLSRQQFVE